MNVLHSGSESATINQKLLLSHNAYKVIRAIVIILFILGSQSNGNSEIFGFSEKTWESIDFLLWKRGINWLEDIQECSMKINGCSWFWFLVLSIDWNLKCLNFRGSFLWLWPVNLFRKLTKQNKASQNYFVCVWKCSRKEVWRDALVRFFAVQFEIQKDAALRR